MKFRLSCWRCVDDAVASAPVALPLRDDGVYQFHCARHGLNVVDVQNLRFELLFESAALSLADDRTRDAVLDLGAALERFFEFYLEYARRRRAVSDVSFKAAWKHLRGASERQFGAFLFVWLLEHGEPATFPTDWAEFRNRVVHQGYVPDFDETIRHGEAVRAFVSAALERSRISGAAQFTAAVIRGASREVGSLVPGAHYSSVHLPTLVSALGTLDGRTLAHHVGMLKQYWSQGSSSRFPNDAG